MRFFKFWILGLSLAFLGGCAAMSYAQRNVEDGRYAAALYSVTYMHSSVRDKEVEEVAKKIKEKAGSNYQNEFFQQTISEIKHGEKTDFFYSYMYRYIEYSEQYGLLSADQIDTAMALLQRELAASVVNDPKILDEKNKRFYPNLSKYMAEAHEAEYQRALNSELPNLGRYVRAYNNAKDSGKASNLLSILRARTAEVAGASVADPSFLTEVLAAHLAANDPEITASAKRFIGAADLSKSQLKDEVADVFPDVAKKELSKREVIIKIVTDSNDPFIDELSEALAAIDEWISVDEDATRKLNIVRLRFNERESGPVIRTLTVQNLDFLTLLFIPKNASVLYDSVATSYDISWSMSVSDSASKGSKVISGKNGAQRIECSNIRFRNVFGGEGALASMPADIQGYCNSSSSVDFSAMRKDAVIRIAQEIAGVIRAGGNGAAQKKAIPR